MSPVAECCRCCAAAIYAHVVLRERLIGEVRAATISVVGFGHECDNERCLPGALQLRGGMTYWLIAVRAIGGFHGAWGCMPCGKTGYCGIHNSAQEAITSAKTGAEAYHDGSHSADPRRPR